MKVIQALLFSCVLAVSFSVSTSTASADEKFETYLNGRFGFKVDHPADFKKSTDPENGAGNSFTSPDGDFTLLVQGHFLHESTLDAVYKEQSTALGETVGYRVKKKDFFVLSGTKDGQEYYIKYHVKGGNWVELNMSYPAAKKDKYDPLVEKIVKSFKPFLEGDYDRID